MNSNAKVENGIYVDVASLSYSLKIGNGDRTLLNDITFSIEPRDFCAILGPSGAGKRLTS
jgi:ABC-type multidrug transport system fused ATPase/permease subunit